jgi:ABC-type multidrug transport system ATPase subunit
LKQIDFHARKGQLTAVVGNVGSGKSSLLAALLGQMQLTEGTSKVCGQISYTPQEAWLLNMTLRENIVFGNEFNEQLYNEVIRVCALTRDLKLMPDNDRTEIGERGINLSGGQRQRISLARCCYKQSDVVLLDDPLSAVDQKVGRHIFEDCIKKYLKARTVIFVTHQLQYLSKCDYVYVVKDGRVAEGGTYLELMSRKDNGLLAQLIGQHVTTEKNLISKEKIEKVEKEIHQRRGSNKSVSSIEGPTNETHPALLSRAQLENRQRLSNRFHTFINDEILASKIEDNQLRMTINPIARKGMSIASQLEPDEPVPEDAEPMKLVLEDQSIHYKKSPALAYMQAGTGVFISVSIVALFFLVHGVRIGSG